MTIHRSSVGTYHPAPGSDVAWTVHDTRGYLDGGPVCEGEGCPEPCECSDEPCEECGHVMHDESDIAETQAELDACKCCEMWHECIGLSFAYVCLDGGEALCPACAEKEGVKVVGCDCP